MGKMESSSILTESSRNIRTRLFTTTQIPDSFNAATVGQTATGDQENYLTFINPGCEDLKRTAAFLHEMLHIYHNDFIDERPVEEIEADRRKELIQVAKYLIEEDKKFNQDTESFKMNEAESMLQREGDDNGKH